MEFEERILSLPSRYPWLFKDTGLAAARRIAVVVFFLTSFVMLFTIPELVWDEYLNEAFYRDKLGAYEQAYRETHATVGSNEEILRDWFSPRMWNYRNLIYQVHVRKRFDGTEDFVKKLAEWQFEEAGATASAMQLHYLYNPGFFWDIAVLLPLSLTALAMGLYYLAGHLGASQFPTKRGYRPYIPRRAAATFVRSIINPWTMGSCLVGAILITAGNHGTGWIITDIPEPGIQRDVFNVCLIVGYAALIPYVFIAFRSSRNIFQECGSSAVDTRQVQCNDNRLRSRGEWLRWVFWVTAASSVIALTLVLSSDNGMIEGLTGTKLAPIKPVQRVMRYFLQGMGVLSCIWVVTMIVGCGRRSMAVRDMAEPLKLELTKRAEVFNVLVLEEIRFLEYFGMFATLTILSYAQSAVFIWQLAPPGTIFGLSVLAGLILIALVLMIIPIIYLWYLYIDSRRFDMWVDMLLKGGKLSARELHELREIQNSRLIHVLKLVVGRVRFFLPVLVLFGTLFYAGGIMGLLSTLINAFS